MRKRESTRDDVRKVTGARRRRSFQAIAGTLAFTLSEMGVIAEF